MPVSDDYAAMDAISMAELVKTGDIHPKELVETAISRIETLNPKLNAVITPIFEQALETAAGDLPDGPFRGVPFLVKDLGGAVAGVPMSMGCKMMKGFVPGMDSELVRRQKKAGLIVLGKTNVPEFGLMPVTEPEAFGPSRNPWDLEKTPGGSSGGSAAAVAAGIVPMAHGNDGGGSIRIPASCCGLFGLKPTRARNSLGPLFGEHMAGLVCEHALTRSVRDSAALLDATSGPMPGDPYWAPPNERPFLDEVGADPGKLRIAVSKTPLRDLPVHADCIAAVEDAARLCEDLGHQVEEASPKIDGDDLVKTFMTIWSAGCAQTMETIAMGVGSPPSSDWVEPATWAIYQLGKEIPAWTYMNAVATLHRISRIMAAFHRTYDLWLTPTLAEPPVPIGKFDPEPNDPVAGLNRTGLFAAYTPIANGTGQPAMSVPLFWNSEGLPVGVQFIGRFGDEATLFRMAAQLEKARPWQGRRPDLIS